MLNAGRKPSSKGHRKGQDTWSHLFLALRICLQQSQVSEMLGKVWNKKKLLFRGGESS